MYWMYCIHVPNRNQGDLLAILYRSLLYQNKLTCYISAGHRLQEGSFSQYHWSKLGRVWVPFHEDYELCHLLPVLFSTVHGLLSRPSTAPVAFSTCRCKEDMVICGPSQGYSAFFIWLKQSQGFSWLMSTLSSVCIHGELLRERSKAKGPNEFPSCLSHLVCFFCSLRLLGFIKTKTLNAAFASGTIGLQVYKLDSTRRNGFAFNPRCQSSCWSIWTWTCVHVNINRIYRYTHNNMEALMYCHCK